VVFWDLATGEALRRFDDLTFSKVGEPGNEERRPNMFKWSADGNFVAQMGAVESETKNSVIKIYTLPSMQLLEKKSLRTNGVMDFQWSPTDGTLAYWAAEKGDTPARVSLVAIPSRAEVRQKNLFNVAECSLHWSPAGDYLAAKVIRHTKTKKTLFNNLELFRIREALVPVETLDLKVMVSLIEWEPAGGSRLALHLAGDPADVKVRPTVALYDMCGGTGKKELTLLRALENRNVSHLKWSPAGGQLVLCALPIANVNDYAGSLEFYDVDALPERGREVEHYRANCVEWDPSGRMLMSAVAQPLEGMVYKFQMDNGFKLWTFQVALPPSAHPALSLSALRVVARAAVSRRA
jgi:translation initiation factor 3 subunit B